MIPRYTRKEMACIWEQEQKLRIWLDIEIAACEAWARLGKIPRGSLSAIKKRAGFDVARVEEIEKTTKHDVAAFVAAVAEKVGRDGRFIHMGLTSSDVLDTAFAIQLRSAADIIIEDIKILLVALRRLALRYKKTPMIGRTHGIHAEPITFGLKVLSWHQEMSRALERMVQAKKAVSFGKLSGVVGTYGNLPPAIEAYVCRKLGLKPDPISTQIVQRDRHAQYFLTLALLASSIERIAQEIRHLQRTEVLEAEEPFSRGQKGSSAMPHKRNPILSENICGLARLVRSYAIASMENIPLWHERDISHSSAERVIAPDATILADFMLNRLKEIIKDLQVYPNRMQENIAMTGGLIFSERVMLTLVERGMSRDEAYKIVQKAAMNTWMAIRAQTDARRGKELFLELLLKDRKVRTLIGREKLEECFFIKHSLSHVDMIFRRALKRNEG